MGNDVVAEKLPAMGRREQIAQITGALLTAAAQNNQERPRREIIKEVRQTTGRDVADIGRVLLELTDRQFIERAIKSGKNGLQLTANGQVFYQQLLEERVSAEQAVPHLRLVPPLD